MPCVARDENFMVIPTKSSWVLITLVMISLKYLLTLYYQGYKSREKNAKQLMRKVKKKDWAKDLFADGTEGRRWT